MSSDTPCPQFRVPERQCASLSLLSSERSCVAVLRLASRRETPLDGMEGIAGGTAGAEAATGGGADAAVDAGAGSGAGASVDLSGSWNITRINICTSFRIEYHTVVGGP